MSKYMRCDICDTDFDLNAPDIVFWSEFRLPANWLPTYAEESEVLSLDICSVECLLSLAKVLNNNEEVEKPSDGPDPDNDDEPSPGPWQQPQPDFDVTVR